MGGAQCRGGHGEMVFDTEIPPLPTGFTVPSCLTPNPTKPSPMGSSPLLPALPAIWVYSLGSRYLEGRGGRTG